MADVSFGEWLKRRRKARGLTQEELALQINCSTSALRKIEAEQRRPSAQIVEQLAEVFNIASGERKSFLKFARGDWQAAPTGVVESAPWRIAPRSEDELEELSNPKIHLVTFLFSDIEGSTKLWESVPEKMKPALARHHAILQEAISSNGGNVFQIVGDAFCAAFPTASSAISAALTAQRALHQEKWDTPSPIRARIGIHTGAAERILNDSPTGGYTSNHTLNRVARILSAGHGGQVLLSLVTKELVKDSLPADAELRDMGEHHLKNLTRPEHLFQLIIADLPSDFPPLNTLDSYRHNLPVQLTSFIGRIREIAEVKYLLSATRLLTLTGPGGTGKTRLSIQVANEVLDQYPDGVWMVELAPILDPLLIPRTTAIAIGLRDEPHRPVIDMLCDYLREKKILLILDNCEHLIEACAQLADRLLHACPQIRILASSREVLGIAGETAYLVPSLKLPDMQDLQTVESLRQCEAIRLFIERASAATQHFNVTDENASSIAQICRRLDGMPLAIELAAARVRVLSVIEIAARLDDRFNLLTAGSRSALPRHQTLRAALDWSYDLLTREEQILFRRLAVFAGGAMLEAVESVCSGEGLERTSVLDLLSHLVDKSFLLAEEGDGATRYLFLETIRQYAIEKLSASGEANGFQSRHFDYFLKLAEEADSPLRSGQRIAWLARLERENDNLRAALDWSQSAGGAQALRLVGTLLWFWFLGDHVNEGRGYAERGLQGAGAGGEADRAGVAARASGLRCAGTLAVIQGDFLAGRAELADSLVLWRDLAGWPSAANSTQSTDESEWPSSQRIASGLAISMHHWGWVLLYQGELAEGQQEMEESIRLLRQSGDTWDLALTLHDLAHAVSLRGAQSAALAYFGESQSLFEGLHDDWGISLALRGRGMVAYRNGDYGRARAYLEEGLLASHRAEANKWNIAQALSLLGEAVQREGDLERAAALFAECLELDHEVGDMARLALILRHLGTIAELQGQADRAVRLFAAAARLQETHQGGRPTSLAEETKDEDALTRARAALDATAFDAAWAEGEKMSIDQAIDYALSEIGEIEKSIRTK